jgi:hypothetical protein
MYDIEKPDENGRRTTALIYVQYSVYIENWGVNRV